MSKSNNEYGAIFKAVLGQKSELISDVGLNFHKGGYSLDFETQGVPAILANGEVMLSRASYERYPIPMREGRLHRSTQTSNISSAAKVDMTFSFDELSKTMKRLDKMTKQYRRNMQYHIRLRTAQIDDDMISVMTLLPKRTKDEMLVSIGSSRKIHRLISSTDPRKTKRGWRLYQRNQK